jgi:chromosome segregation ATPase
MAFKRRGEPATIDDERAALREQHAALEDLKRQLAERVNAVRERELELHHALAEAGGSRQGSTAPPARLSPALVRADAEADTGEEALEAERRERALLEREQAVAERERELLAAAAAPAHREPEPEADATRLAQIEARLAELRDAEKLFLRTREELAARSEAVAARERLVAQKERELDDRDDEKGQWAPKELSEMEARLRRLEQQEPGEQTLGFSGGLRKLGEGTRSQRGG